MIGIFGGTFNPVHWGHVRTALEIKKALDLDAMYLVPSRVPPHRDEPEVDAEVRLAMLKAAIEDFTELEIDDRELQRKGPSYTVDTLRSIRQQQPDITIGLCVGVDAFIHLDTWHQWRQLFDLAHIIIAHRPGWPVDTLTEQVHGELRSVVEQRLVTDAGQLKINSAGLFLPQKVTDIDISSSVIRQYVEQGKSIAGMVPDKVLEIIRQRKLYQSIKGS